MVELVEENHLSVQGLVKHSATQRNTFYRVSEFWSYSEYIYLFRVAKTHCKVVPVHHTSYLSHAPHAVQVSKFPGWCQKIPQIMGILPLPPLWWWQSGGGGTTTTNTTPPLSHSTITTITTKISCIPIYPVLSQFGVKFLSWKWCLCQKIDKYELCSAHLYMHMHPSRV